MRTLTLAFLLALSSPALAGTYGSVTVPDNVTVGNAPLVLNGMGSREKYFFQIYVGALWLPAKTTDAEKAITEDVPKRLSMHFVYSGGVTKQQLVDTYNEGLAKQGDPPALRADYDKLFGWLTDVVAGDEIRFDYVPGVGTTVTVKGVKKGTIAGSGFMKSFFRIYLGASPPTSKFKKGIMGE
jgi:hypothetical protein